MDKSRVEPTIFFIEKISFSLKLYSGHFYGQSFIKTVRGPYEKDIVSSGGGGGGGGTMIFSYIRRLRPFWGVYIF